MLNINKIIDRLLHTVLIGEIKPYAGSNEPTGWMKCDGRAVSRITYAALFNAIGTTYGAGDGSNTFNIPDLRDRFPVGAGNAYALNAKGGAATVTLTVDQIPSHAHNISYAQYQRGTGTATATALQYTGSTKSTDSTGGGKSHNNMPPYIGINFLIYTG